MASEQRIKELAMLVAGWKQYLDAATSRRDRLLTLKETGFQMVDDKREDLLQRQINAADSAARDFQEILTRTESLLSRAIHGENV